MFVTELKNLKIGLTFSYLNPKYRKEVIKMGDDSGDVYYLQGCYCPYCKTTLKQHQTEFQVEYEISLTPPPGARDLGLKSVEKLKGFGPYYSSCSNCGAKYVSGHAGLNSVMEIPDKDALLSEFIKNRVPLSARILRAEVKRNDYVPNCRASQFTDCFIATSVYGSEALEVQVLRKFKNDFLLKNSLSRIFVSFYYCLSPLLARHLKNKKKIRLSIRKIFLDPLINLISVHESRLRP